MVISSGSVPPMGEGRCVADESLSVCLLGFSPVRILSGAEHGSEATAQPQDPSAVGRLGRQERSRMRWRCLPRSSFYSVRMMGRVASWSQGCFPCAPAMSEAPRSVEQGLLAEPLDGSGVGTVAGGGSRALEDAERSRKRPLSGACGHGWRFLRPGQSARGPPLEGQSLSQSGWALR